MKKFYISYIFENPEIRDGSFGLSVVGRCGKETLKIGDTFTGLYSFIPPKTVDGLEQSGKLNYERSIRLTITSIENYGCSFEVMYEGFTAKISLIGIGSDWIKDDGVLCAED